MTQPDRSEWLRVAFPRIADMPEDLLVEACLHAQDTCDHPAKIIPAIKAYAKDRWDTRRMMRANLRRDQIAVADEPEPWMPEPGELDRIKAEAAARLRVNNRG
jgi:hypothetical protein